MTLYVALSTLMHLFLTLGTKILSFLTINFILYVDKMFDFCMGTYYAGTVQWRWDAQFSNLEK